MTLEFAKNHFKLKSEIYKFKEFKDKFLKIYNPKKWQLKALRNLSSVAIALNVFN
ncbi:hypothetical protein ACJOMT_03310 [Mycoplasmopsis synoviae]|uniref:hypothetical protein n=1 Tax=Mycoplasmopsis synoviae TaxID=2109 RepID=UPI000CA2EDA5|nr:hypothetical protein [Mycoplasmopsis synoviae]AKJ20498.1 hypothetical protein MSHv_00120 [Mycoplasmopsis synoviae]AQU47812.1 hypothetical protein ADF19_00120 [Mycoplasmopsis synoviae]